MLPLRPLTDLLALGVNANAKDRDGVSALELLSAANTRSRCQKRLKEAAIAKLVASEAAMDNARDATQIFGGYGFVNEFTVARHYRDSKILEIGEGTTEVQLMLIARQAGL